MWWCERTCNNKTVKGSERQRIVMALRHYGAKVLLAGGLAGALIAPSVSLADKDEDKKKTSDNRPLFDPDALERGAKALREINKSPYAKQVCRVDGR